MTATAHNPTVILVQVVQRSFRSWFPGLLLCLACAGGPFVSAQEPLPEAQHPAPVAPADSGDRVVTPEEVRKQTNAGGVPFFRALSWPGRKVASGMEKGLIRFERHHLREKLRMWQEDLRRRGIEGSFGGAGEQTGLGVGGSHTARFSEKQALRFLGRITSLNYQEFDVRWQAALPASELSFEGSYQWRPQENFYGIGHDSLRSQHADFALRQTWTGVHFDLHPVKWFQWGAMYRLMWLRAQPGESSSTVSVEHYFPNLAGFRTQTSMQSTGTYIDLQYLPEEYKLGGMLHLGASHQNGLGRNKLDYFNYEVQLEGRKPIAGRGVLVAEGNLQLNRERHGSDPIPFYLLAHAGGSSTLRGFSLDRFYGRSLALVSLEYRYKIHPNIQAYPFFDEGQIFNSVKDVSWTNWHRNYGLGFRLRTARSTVLRIEYGKSSEGSHFHIIFGDRERPPLSAPVRYGVYKR